MLDNFKQFGEYTDMAHNRKNREFEERIAMLVRKKGLMQRTESQARLGRHFDWGILLGFFSGLALAALLYWATL